MSRGDVFCVSCGAPPPHSSDRLCEDCFRQRNTLSICNETTQAIRCPKCGMNHESGRWGYLEPDELHQRRLDDSLQLHERAENVGVAFHAVEIDDRNTRLHIDVDGRIELYDFSEQHELMVRTSNAICITCTRKDGNYYEATLQIRSAGRKLEESELMEIRQSLDAHLASMEPDPMFFITKEGAVVGGWDITLGSKSLARSWARHMIQRWGGQTKETNSVVGQKDGVDVTRLTLLYRKPGYDLGDVLRWRDTLWIVQSWQKDGAILISMERNEKTGATWRDLEKGNVLCRFVDQIEIDVLNRDSSVAEFMDPNDFKMKSVRLPHDDDGQQDKLRIGWVTDEWFAIPRVRNTDEGV
ncbi:MAG: NMD3-related protein [Candidatus Thermoplasmatota archaeon]|nr:NMD3-related protein [Candidatus Thermoplasmatota archaeon]